MLSLNAVGTTALLAVSGLFFAGTCQQLHSGFGDRAWCWNDSIHCEIGSRENHTGSTSEPVSNAKGTRYFVRHAGITCDTLLFVGLTKEIAWVPVDSGVLVSVHDPATDLSRHYLLNCVSGTVTEPRAGTDFRQLAVVAGHTLASRWVGPPLGGRLDLDGKCIYTESTKRICDIRISRDAQFAFWRSGSDQYYVRVGHDKPMRLRTQKSLSMDQIYHSGKVYYSALDSLVPSGPFVKGGVAHSHIRYLDLFSGKTARVERPGVPLYYHETDTIYWVTRK